MRFKTRGALLALRGGNKTVRRGSLTPPKPPTVGLPDQFCYRL